ncbi:hypothetical protein D9M71_548740 [compost metagenome]
MYHCVDVAIALTVRMLVVGGGTTKRAVLCAHYAEQRAAFFNSSQPLAIRGVVLIKKSETLEHCCDFRLTLADILQLLTQCAAVPGCFLKFGLRRVYLSSMLAE